MEHIFKNSLKAEKFLEDNGFKWFDDTCEFVNQQTGEHAGITDYGHKAVVDIW